MRSVPACSGTLHAASSGLPTTACTVQVPPTLKGYESAGKTRGKEPGSAPICRNKPPTMSERLSLTFDPWGTAYVAIGTEEFMTYGGAGYEMLRLWSRDTLDTASEWSSEILDWSWGYSITNRLDFNPASNELGVVNWSVLRPDSPLRLVRKQLP